MLLCKAESTSQRDGTKVNSFNFNSIVFQTESSRAVQSPGFTCFLVFLNGCFYPFFGFLYTFSLLQNKKKNKTHITNSPPKPETTYKKSKLNNASEESPGPKYSSDLFFFVWGDVVGMGSGGFFLLRVGCCG